MKKFLMGAATALAIAAPSIAAAETSGNIDVSLGSTEYDNFGSFDNYNLGGAVQIDAMSGWAVTLEGRTTLQQWDHDPSDHSHAYAAVHADTNTGAWDFGGWFGLINYYGEGGTMFGGETRTSFGNFSLQASISYANFDRYNDLDATNYRVQGSYFINPNFAINANVGMTNIGYSPEIDLTQVGVGASYGFGNGFELYGGYDNNDIDHGASSNEQTGTWNLGLRYHFNGGSLQDNVNDGASWGGARALSDALMLW